mmetsp:Transcript_53896/g.60217  ORF Transcript_53896/g.60217 Transcript_53896/m.60217 type:complete len:427 (-) Transcript_53896:256-1536(-)
MSPSAERDDTMTSGHGSSSSFNVRFNTGNIDSGRSIAKGGVTTPFPWKLHIMLDAMEKNEGDKSIVCWQPHGKAFMVHKPKDFVVEVMPHFFNQTKYASFQRQLNLYGFSRLTHGPDKGAYYHHCFVRGKRDFCKGMVRQKIKGTKVRKSLSSEDEPNFYIEDHNGRDLDHFFTSKIDTITTTKFQQERNSSLMQQSSVDSNIISPDSVKFIKPSQTVSSEESLVSLIPMFPSDYTKTTSMSTNSLVSSTTSEGTGDEAPTTNTSYESNRPDFISQKTVSFIPRIVVPRNRTVSYDTNSLQQVFITPVTPTTHIIKGGDLLFFEGQPFRYLEHFEEVPHINDCNNIRMMGKLDNYGIHSNDDNTTKPRLISRSKRSNHPFLTQTACTTDKFHDMISNIMFNIGSSSSSSSHSLQNDLQLHNTSCPA